MHSGINYLVEVVRQDLARQTHRDTLGALGEQQRELGGQCERLALAAVIGQAPVGHLGIIDRIQGEFAQAGLDVTAGSRTVAGEDVTPVTLGVDEQLLLSQLDQRAVDRRIAVGVILHRQTHDVGHLVEVAVVGLLHGVHDASLHGLEAVLDVGNGALEYYVGGIVEKPVLVHAAQLQFLIFGHLVRGMGLRLTATVAVITAIGGSGIGTVVIVLGTALGRVLLLHAFQFVVVFLHIKSAF